MYITDKHSMDIYWLYSPCSLTCIRLSPTQTVRISPKNPTLQKKLKTFKNSASTTQLYEQFISSKTLSLLDCKPSQAGPSLFLY